MVIDSGNIPSRKLETKTVYKGEILTVAQSEII